MIIGEKQSIIEDQVTQDIDNIKNEILSFRNIIKRNILVN